MQTYLARKSKKYLLHYFYIFYPCLDNFVQSGELHLWKILFTKNVIQSRQFYPLKILSSLVLIFLSSVDTFTGAQTFIPCKYFYPVQIPSSSTQTFIQCKYFFPVQILLSSAQTFFRTKQRTCNQINVKYYIKHFLKQLIVFFLFSQSQFPAGCTEV